MKTERLEAQLRRDNLQFMGSMIKVMIKVMNLGKNRRPGCEITSMNTLPLMKLPSKSKERIVSGVKKSPQPIIVKFSHFKDRENVLNAYCEKRKSIVNQAPENPTNEEDVW